MGELTVDKNRAKFWQDFLVGFDTIYLGFGTIFLGYQKIVKNRAILILKSRAILEPCTKILTKFVPTYG